VPEPAFAVWITGLPASGKSTITSQLKNLLSQRGFEVEVLESDVLRQTLGGSYDEGGREAFYRRMVWIGTLLVKHGVPVIFDATANRQSYRDAARKQIAQFFEVFVDVPLETCMARDPKGIYRNAKADVPGLQAPYEPPENPDLVIDGLRESPEEAAKRILDILPLTSGTPRRGLP
jgi:adenylylsulfate kinase